MPFLEEIRLTNLLSFGPETPALRLRPLNVLIGPNGSGKSNFIEAINMLRHAPTDLGREVQLIGGVQQVIWKGANSQPATIDATMDLENLEENDAVSRLRHQISFTASNSEFHVVDESLGLLGTTRASNELQSLFRYGDGGLIIRVDEREKTTPLEKAARQNSMLALRKDAFQYPLMTALGKAYGSIRLYRNTIMGEFAPVRNPQSARKSDKEVDEYFGNVGLVLERISRQPNIKEEFIRALSNLYRGIDDFEVKLIDEYVQVILQEGKFSIPATRLSDGTLRYLCLLAILLHPEPPPLVCIEEPELGLHPDVLSNLGPLLKEASQRMQLIVTTHSDELVDSLSDEPEDVIVCEKVDGSTQMRRLDGPALAAWLEKYTLGELWRRGDLGGNRW